MNYFLFCSFGEWSSSKSQKPLPHNQWNQMCPTAVGRRKLVSEEEKLLIFKGSYCNSKDFINTRVVVQRAGRPKMATMTAVTRMQMSPVRIRSPKHHGIHQPVAAANLAAPSTDPEVNRSFCGCLETSADLLLHGCFVLKGLQPEQGPPGPWTAALTTLTAGQTRSASTRRTALCLSTTQKAKLKFLTLSLTLTHVTQARALRHSLSSPPTRTHAPTTSSEQVRWEQLSKMFSPNYSDRLWLHRKHHTHDCCVLQLFDSACLSVYLWVPPGYRWERQLVFRSKLTMHTAFDRKDNAHPAEISSLAISKWAISQITNQKKLLSF